MPTGLTLGYEYGTAIESRLIEYSEAGMGPSHATTLVGPDWVIDARLSGGIKHRPLSYLKHDRMRWLRLPMPEEKIAATVAFLDRQCGEKYAWGDVFAFIAPALFKPFTGAVHPWMCSYLQIAAEVAGGALLKPPFPLERLDPLNAMLMNAAAGAIEIPKPVFY